MSTITACISSSKVDM